MSSFGQADDDNNLLFDSNTGDDDLLSPDWASKPAAAPSLPAPLNPIPSSAPNAKPSAPASLCWCFDLRSYQPYFDVSTSLVNQRIISSLQFYKTSAKTGNADYFVADVLSQGSGPDAYGPFWITMTLVFVVSVTSNISKWFYASTQDFEVGARVRGAKRRYFHASCDAAS